ncbi:serine--tRNA ligase, mitochondrial-like [Paramacrobiotus metropolitanus]|uniref:serine--tRNA ligase, mitochondrial-like n=1 Tax=Paramacrobiotus metropolitanus TaxID=2943436 RepID=UPI002445827C|nr:serine--tRNA ligase, mitochondrial-like [Paramacrobiotus metropolitanus]
MAKVLELLGSRPVQEFPVKTVEQIAHAYHALRRTKLHGFSSDRAYFFSGFLAQLEQALLEYSVGFLRQRGFQLLSVPDVLRPQVLEGCGMLKDGDRNMVYLLNPRRHGQWALSGTAEMAFGAFWQNKRLAASQLPVRMAAVSRCYRAEISDIQEGIYRVHEFNKVEMFSVCHPQRSDDEHRYFLGLQTEIVNALQLHAQVLDMPENDLGMSAARKFDIEAWMPGQGRYGEISSTSNCRDFQSLRLNISFDADEKVSNERDSSSRQFVHTVNGTACAVPRLIIALLEQHQIHNGSVRIPAVLRPYFHGAELIDKPDEVPALKWRKKGKVVKEE